MNIPPNSHRHLPGRSVLLWFTAVLFLFLRLTAADVPFLLGGIPQLLSEVDDRTEVYFRGMRFNQAMGEWNVDLSVSNRSVTPLTGPLVVTIISPTGRTRVLRPDGTNGLGQTYLDLTPQLAGGVLPAGAVTDVRLLALEFAVGVPPSIQARVYAPGTVPTLALVQTRTVDEAGLPLSSVMVEEVGGTGESMVTDPTSGWVTLARSSGPRTWRFSAAGFLPTWRSLLVANGVQVVPHPRLVRRSGRIFPVTPLSGGRVELPEFGLQLTIPPAAVAVETPVTVTGLSGQNLPSLLPRGWSPLQAFTLESGGPMTLPARARLAPWGSLAAGEAVVLVRLNETALRWEVVALAGGAGTNALSVDLSGPGTWALVVGDAVPHAPPPARVGQPLEASVLALPLVENLRATGEVRPSSRPASRNPERVTAEAEVVVSHPGGPIPSGLLLRCDLRDRYLLSDGSRRTPASYDHFIVAYQRPGDALADTVHARFPLRPLLLFGAEDLTEALVHVDVLGDTTFQGGVLTEAGGSVTTDGVRLLALAGDFQRPEAVLVRRLDPDRFTPSIPPTHSIAAVFEVNLAGLAPGRRLHPQVEGLPPGTRYVLARVVSEEGIDGLEPRERLTTDASGMLQSLEPIEGERLEGLNRSGQYLLVRVPQPLGLVTGVARNAAGIPTPGLAVRLEPWLTISGAGGLYRLLGPVGLSGLTVLDPVTGNSGQGTADVRETSGVYPTDLVAAASGPRVIATSPTNGAVQVSRVVPVVVTFSEPVHPARVAAGDVRLLDAAGVVVPASVTLNLRGTSVTLLPSAPLAGGTRHTLAVSNRLTDLTGLPLEGPSEFPFTTEADPATRLAGVVTSHEPTNGVAGLTGSPGTAEPEAPVILVNETTGTTATILSRVDGSFSNSIVAGVDDFLSAVIVNRNGTRDRVPVSRQMFRDGSVGLFGGGGILEAQSDGGPVQVIVEPGAIEVKTKFKLTPIPFGTLTNTLGTLPATAQLLGGLMLTQEGDDLKVGADISFPVDIAALGLTNAPENCTWALATPREIDGETVYEIVDRMHYEDGRLVTHSPPFTGALLKELQRRFKGAGKFDKKNRQISKALGIPDLKTAFYNVALLPLLMAQGRSLIVTGEAYSAEVDADGKDVPGTKRLLPGANVMFAYEEFQNLPGRLQPGATFTTSGSDGIYSILFPINRLQENGFLVRGTHPAFPLQRTAVPITIPSIAQQFNSIAGPVLGPNPGFLDALNAVNNALSSITPKVAAHLRFARIGPIDVASEDAGPPVVSLAISPRDPIPGTNQTDGAVITVTAEDDLQISGVSLSLIESKTLNPDITTNDVTLTLIPGTQTNRGPAFTQNSWRLRSPFRANVEIRATGTDAAGNASEARTVVQLIGDRVFPPRGTNDTLGPRVLTTFPLPNATGVRPGTPVLLQFSEPVAATNLPNVAQWLTINGGATLASASLSGDGRQLTVFLAPEPSNPNEVVSITLGSALVDLAGNGFDQEPVADGEQSHTLQFNLVPGQSRNLDAMEFGGGVVTQGAYAYALERTGPLDGAMVVYNLQSNTPVRLAELNLPGYPRDLAFVPGLSFKRRLSEPAVTNHDLVAVVGGVTGSESLQYLWIIDVTDPAQPQRIAGANIALGGAAVTKVLWSFPFLGYLEANADITSLALVDLQAFVLGMNAGRDEIATFPEFDQLGVDANRDGDFIDDLDTLPLPRRNPTDYFGKLFSIVDSESDRRIEDFDMEVNRGLVGLVLRAGHPLGSNGLPDLSRTVPPAYRTVFAGLQSLEPTNATVNFPAEFLPRRVALLPQVLLEGSTNQTFRDLAVVSLSSTVATSNLLAVIDITDPNRPEILSNIDLTGYGVPQSLKRREDGLLALATQADVLLLDPTRFLLRPVAGGGIAGLDRDHPRRGQRRAFLCGGECRFQCRQRRRCPSRHLYRAQYPVPCLSAWWPAERLLSQAVQRLAARRHLRSCPIPAAAAEVAVVPVLRQQPASGDRPDQRPLAVLRPRRCPRHAREFQRGDRPRGGIPQQRRASLPGAQSRGASRAVRSDQHAPGAGRHQRLPNERLSVPADPAGHPHVGSSDQSLLQRLPRRPDRPDRRAADEQPGRPGPATASARDLAARSIPLGRTRCHQPSRCLPDQHPFPGRVPSVVSRDVGGGGRLACAAAGLVPPWDRGFLPRRHHGQFADSKRDWQCCRRTLDRVRGGRQPPRAEPDQCEQHQHRGLGCHPTRDPAGRVPSHLQQFPGLPHRRPGVRRIQLPGGPLQGMAEVPGADQRPHGSGVQAAGPVRLSL